MGGQITRNAFYGKRLIHYPLLSDTKPPLKASSLLAVTSLRSLKRGVCGGGGLELRSCVR